MDVENKDILWTDKKVIFALIDRIQTEVSNYETNRKSAIIDEIESELQAQRIDNILKICIQYIKLALCLPHFVINAPGIGTIDTITTRDTFISMFSRFLYKFHHQNGIAETMKIHECQVCLSVKTLAHPIIELFIPIQ